MRLVTIFAIAFFMLFVSCETVELTDIITTESEANDTSDDVQGEEEDETDGEDGKDGSDGEDGENGSDGEDGSDDEDGTDDQDEEVENGVDVISMYLDAGSWKVTEYIQKTGVGSDELVDKTDELSEFEFDFDSATGELTIRQGENSIAQIEWSVGGDTTAGFFLDLDFDDLLPALGLLTNQWFTASVTETRIGFIIGELDVENNIDTRIFLTFERV